MQKYNRALDYVALAMDNMQKGRVKTAAKFFAKACVAPDADYALSIIEASNAYAYAQHKEAKAKARAEAASNPENRILAALGADREELGLEPEGEPGKVDDEAVEEEDKEFHAALAALVTK